MATTADPTDTYATRDFSFGDQIAEKGEDLSQRDPKVPDGQLADFRLAGLIGPKPELAPDYERDNLAQVDLAAADKNTLLVIAAYEGADAQKGDRSTKAELVKAIEAKRAS